MELFEYRDQFKNAVMDYKLSEEQLRYTATPLECIGLSERDSTRHSILAMEMNKLVTFFVLHEKDGVTPYSKNSKAMLLRAFSTDFYQQGKGYAKKSLMLLPQFVNNNFPYIDEIVLAVNLKNTAAQSLYKKCGYIDEGIRRKGRKGELIIMSYYLYKKTVLN